MSTVKVEVAPWALSAMAAGGRALIPQEPFVEHGVSFTPARPVVLWRFSRMNDPRFTGGDRLIQFRQDEASLVAALQPYLKVAL